MRLVRTFVFFLGLVLLAGASAWATPSPGLLYINGGNSSVTVAGTFDLVAATFSIPGDTVVVFATLLATSTGVSCADNNLNPLTAGPSVTYGLNTVYSFYYTVPSTTPGNFKVSWVGNSKAVVQYAEYYGVLSVNASLSPNTATGVTGNPTITTTTTGPNSYVVCGMAGGTSPAITGTLREFGFVSAPSMSLATIDNTAVSAGSVTVTTTTDGLAAWGVVALELLYAPAPAIAYSGGTETDTTSASTTLTATYTATIVGDEIVVFVETEVPAGIITVKGNTTSTALTAGPVESTATASIYSFYGPAQASDTGYVANWTNSSAASSITLGEYLGVQSVLSSNTNTGTSTSLTIGTATITHANDWLVAALGDITGFTVSATAGTLRQQVTASSTHQSLIDNTAATAGATVAITGSIPSSHIWVATTLELVAYQAATATKTMMPVVY
jgi:hypothetical protein